LTKNNFYDKLGEKNEGDRKMPKRIMKTKFYLIEDLVDILGLTKESIRLYVKAGRIHGIKIGSMWHISQEDVNHFLRTGDCKIPRML
jgi:hypothetical protein